MSTSAAAQVIQAAQPYTLEFIHSIVTKTAPTIGKWLPSAVHASLVDLEKVVSETVHAPPPSRQNNRHHGGNRGYHRSSKPNNQPQWQNKNWDNFRSFKATQVLSSETPVSKFRTAFNKLTDKTTKSTVVTLNDILGEVEKSDETTVLPEMANAVLKGAIASPGNCDLYAQFLSQCATNGAVTNNFTACVLFTLKNHCIKQTTKANTPEDDSYDALCAANEANDKSTTHLKLAVLCEKYGVLAPGSTGLLLQKVAKKLAKLGSKKEDKFEAEVLVTRLVTVLEANGAKPSDTLREIMDTIVSNCGKKSEFPGLGNKVMFTLMDYFDTLEE